MNSSIYILVFVQLWLFSLPCRESVCIPSERETLLKFKNNLIDPPFFFLAYLILNICCQ
ncbi:hypothetical protein GLYMA_16G187966v4 [Glycine max]|nr:hypothetical protein GLYMA_16G187966v4 [Glycine max]